MISIRNLTFGYKDKLIYDNFNLDISKGKTTVILGESGSGKTTLLNILANLVQFDGEIMGMDKRFSMIFQKDRLIKNLTIEENLKLINPQVDIEKALSMVGLNGYEKAYIKSLSAGMARRVAILRALIFDCETLLFDEPFINLDLKLKFSIMQKIQEQKMGKTIILVTHDIKEAAFLGDRIVILKNGKIDFEISNDKKDKEKLEKILFEQMIK